MKYDYEVIAKVTADLSRQMQKLNNQLDRIIDKRGELNDPQAKKDEAIALLRNLEWEEAARLCTEQTREADKHARLEAEEERIRAELEALREQLSAAATGAMQAPSKEATGDD